jgi:hypothetical protein
MTSPEQQWDGPIQDAIRRHDEALGHRPKAQPEGPTILLARSCCNPRPWQPICVDCPGRFTSGNLEES